jgi:hypothetical protein
MCDAASGGEVERLQLNCGSNRYSDWIKKVTALDVSRRFRWRIDQICAHPLIDAAEMARSTFRSRTETAVIAPKNNSALPVSVREYVRLTNSGRNVVSPLALDRPRTLRIGFCARAGTDVTNLQEVAGPIIPPRLLASTFSAWPSVKQKQSPL